MSDALGLRPGQVIGRDFEVVKLLASGAMGSVYVVDQISTGKQRAMKVMSVELANNARARERFVLEARVGANIESEHVVEVVTAGIDDETGVPYLVMELLNGEELADMLARQGPLDAHMTAEILKQAGHALAAAHQKGIVHRDIKPENLFVAASRREGIDFTVKILDFGIAKLVAERTHEGTQPIGTPLFMAPEQTDRRGEISPASDVWPIGLLAFRMLTGRDYWQGAFEGITKLLREIVMDPIEAPSSRAATYGCGELLPPGFDGWFLRCVNRDPAQRFSEAGECVAAFYDLVQGTPRRAPPPPRADTIQAAPAQGGDAAALAAVAQPAKSTAGGTAKAVEIAAELPQTGSKAGVVIGGVVAVAALGAAIYFVTGDDEPEKLPAASATAPAPTASAPTAPAKPLCPDGMVFTKGGNMFMGSSDDDLSDNVRPPHKVTVSDFCLDKLEVTVAQYEACSAKGNCERSTGKVVFEGLSPKLIGAFEQLCNVGKADKAQHPINCVTWAMADGYCKAKGGRTAEGGARLPSEAEWEFAARGSGQRVYPWGDDAPDQEHLNGCGVECAKWYKDSGLPAPTATMYDGDDGFPATAPVGSYPKGASSMGVLDLAGNVFEWTSDWYGPYSKEPAVAPKGPDTGKERVARGGAFNGTDPAWAKPAFRFRTNPEHSSHGIGFRCAVAPAN